jgi:hypothetical protein
MKWKSICIPALLAAGLYLGNGSVSLAQPQQPPLGASKFRPQVHIDLFTPQGGRLNQRDEHYHYIVPPTDRHGAFYTFDNTYYYTPMATRGPGQRAPRPVAMQFGGSRHLVELGERLETLANELCLDLHHNYGHNPRFKEVYAEAYQFLQATKFIRDRGHQGDREAIRRSVTKIDNLFHHIQDDLAILKRQERRPVGPHGLEAKTEELQALIHHLMYDQGVKPDHDKHNNDRRDPRGRQEAPPPRR